MASRTVVIVKGTAKSTGKHFEVEAYDGPTNDSSAGAVDASLKIKAAMEPTGAFSDINISITQTPLS